MSHQHINVLLQLLMMVCYSCGVSYTDAAGVCTQRQAQMAETKVLSARSWDEIYRLYREHGNCDDGAIAEGFSEVVTLQLDENWMQIDRLSYMIRKNPKFETFVIAHISASVPGERLVRIQFNASELCPSHLRSLCQAIQIAASDAAK